MLQMKFFVWSQVTFEFNQAIFDCLGILPIDNTIKDQFDYFLNLKLWSKLFWFLKNDLLEHLFLERMLKMQFLEYSTVNFGPMEQFIII